MAYRVTQRIISSDDLLYPYFDDLCRKSKLLYNAALFRVRNIFTGYDKEHRTENEVEVFQEVANVLKTQTARKARKLYGETILKKYYWKPYFWSDSYFISSVSENSLHTIKQYIRNQGKR